jgi:hypothetical protein
MTTTINQKVANPNFPTGGASGTTGTGDLVFSESPTINNPNLTGNVSANVNLRSGTLATLLPLAGGTSEIGYATDANALVRFNGTAGGAVVLSGSSTIFTLNASNVVALTTPGSGVFIDCNNISYLYVTIDPAIQNDGQAYANLNIKLPNSTTIPSFKVVIQSIRFLEFWDEIDFKITLAYQSGDPAATIGYKAIAADRPTFSGDKPTFVFNNYNAVEINFVAAVTGNQAASYWTRLPLAGEGAYNFVSPADTIIGRQLNFNGSPVALTSGVVASSGSVSLSPGIWLLSGSVDFTVSSTLVATEMIAGINLGNTTAAPVVSSTNSAVRMTANLPTAGTFTLAIPPIVLSTQSGTASTIRYANMSATFSAGTVTARIIQRAIKLG